MMPFGHSAVFMRHCQLHYEFVERKERNNKLLHRYKKSRQTIISILCRNIPIICTMLFQLNGGKLPLLLNSDVTFPKLFCYLKFVVITPPFLLYSWLIFPVLGTKKGFISPL